MENWIKELNYFSNIKIPRCFQLTKALNTELHIFCDASESAFSAVSYIRVQTGNEIKCNLIRAKSRLAPLKKLTLPRLELQGAVLGVRLKTFITQEIDTGFDSILFWTDSMINLQYIQNEERRFKVFVSNRVSEIRRHSEVSQWRHIEGNKNPADLATRGISLEELNKTSRWLYGPEFLYKDKTEWPNNQITRIDANDKELKADIGDIKLAVQTTCRVESLIQYERFSKWTRLIHTMAYVQKFIQKCRRKDKNIEKCSTITVKEFTDAKTALIILVQNDVFHQEIIDIQDNACLKSNHALSKLDPFLYNIGLLRVGGRLKYALIPYASKHQIILPSRHHCTMLLIRHIHKINFHCGKEHLMSILRQEYWIIKGREMVNNVLQKCVICKKLRPKQVFPKVANLQKE